VFGTVILPVRRGILATAYGRVRPEAASGDLAGAVRRALASFAEGRPFVRVVEPEEVALHAVVGTNRVVLGARADAARGVVVAVAAIDNLVKGAAGQALRAGAAADPARGVEDLEVQVLELEGSGEAGQAPAQDHHIP